MSERGRNRAQDATSSTDRRRILRLNRLFKTPGREYDRDLKSLVAKTQLQLNNQLSPKISSINLNVFIAIEFLATKDLGSAISALFELRNSLRIGLAFDIEQASMKVM